jgi:hypothetical protein
VKHLCCDQYASVAVKMLIAFPLVVTSVGFDVNSNQQQSAYRLNSAKCYMC